jgi:hypothetical protein
MEAGRWCARATKEASCRGEGDLGDWRLTELREGRAKDGDEGTTLSIVEQSTTVVGLRRPSRCIRDRSGGDASETRGRRAAANEKPRDLNKGHVTALWKNS